MGRGGSRRSFGKNKLVVDFMFMLRAVRYIVVRLSGKMYVCVCVRELHRRHLTARLEAAAAEASRGGVDEENENGDGDGDGEKSLQIHTVSANFRAMREELARLTPPGLEDGGVDGILMDLGVSSMHLDLPERGKGWCPVEVLG